MGPKVNLRKYNMLSYTIRCRFIGEIIGQLEGHKAFPLTLYLRDVLEKLEQMQSIFSGYKRNMHSIIGKLQT